MNQNVRMELTDKCPVRRRLGLSATFIMSKRPAPSDSDSESDIIHGLRADLIPWAKRIAASWRRDAPGRARKSNASASVARTSDPAWLQERWQKHQPRRCDRDEGASSGIGSSDLPAPSGLVSSDPPGERVEVRTSTVPLDSIVDQPRSSASAPVSSSGVEVPAAEDGGAPFSEEAFEEDRPFACR